MKTFLPARWVSIIALSCCSLLSCSRLIPTGQTTQSDGAKDDVAVIEARPLPTPDFSPQKLAAQQDRLIPWIQPSFLASVTRDNDVNQGLWIQAADQVLAAHQADTLLSTASITKVATSLAAIDRLGPNFRFVTQFGTVGPVTDGTLTGDLVIAGGDDPLFVWEDAFAVAQELNDLGIQKITGDLIIQSPFVMNFETDTQVSATLFRQSLNALDWPPEAIAQFQTLSPDTPKPNITLQGNIKIVNALPPNTTWRVKHASLPLIELLKRMNRYSNNPMADQLANTLGGAAVVMETVRSHTNLNTTEIQLINGSGLGPENQMTPQGVTLMLQALSNLLQSQGFSLGDVLTIIGTDEGILDSRPLPKGVILKSGTLNQVSALAGVLPTRDQGLVWFTMLHSQGDIESYRQTQEALLQKMATAWGSIDPPALLAPTLDPKQLVPITERL